MRGLPLIALCLALAAPAGAAVLPTPGAEDRRIRSVAYNAEQVVQLKGFIGYQLMVEFGVDERIENVAVGDSTLWQVTPNRRANLLFIKPLSALGATNMTVVTDQRRYAFELVPASAAIDATDLAYIVRFQYPVLDAAAGDGPVRAKALNTSYGLKGARAVLPLEVFDDGRFTYFQWPADAALPAVFIIAADGGESVANYGVREGFVVIETTAQAFRLRHGKDVATVTNRAWGSVTTAQAEGRR